MLFPMGVDSIDIVGAFLLVGDSVVDVVSLNVLLGVVNFLQTTMLVDGNARPPSTPRKQKKNVGFRVEGRTIPLVVDSVVCADSTVVVDVAASLVSVAIEGSKFQSTTSWYVSLHATL